MKKKLFVAVFLVVLFFSANVAIAQKTDIGGPEYKEVYINLDAVWRASDKGKEDITKIDQLVKESRDSLDKLRNEMVALKNEFDKATTDKDKETKANLLEQKRRELIELTATKNKEIDQLKGEAQQKFVDGIVPIINNYRSEKGYLVIHRFSPNDVISVDPKLDITGAILELYNKKSP